MDINGESYPVLEAEIHFPYANGIRYLDMMFSGQDGGFVFSRVELTLLENLDDLDGQRIHVHANGESFEDDTLGTDIIGMNDFTDCNLWSYPNGRYYYYGDIQIDFKKIEGRTYRCTLRCQLTTDTEMEVTELPPEAFVEGTAEFDVVVDEENPKEIGM